jgi:hypothetical protein
MSEATFSSIFDTTFSFKVPELGPLYNRAQGRLIHDMQTMWLVKKSKMVQVHFTLDFEGLVDQRNLNGLQIHMASYKAPSG